MTGVGERVRAATAGRDRVVDAAKAIALFLVVVGHSLAWHVTPSGAAINVLEIAPAMVALSWLFQVLPLFFAVGAVSNAESLQRHGARAFVTHRARRLLTPVLVYTAFWTVVLVPLAVIGGATVVGIGVFFAQLLWFAGVYLIVVTAVPLTSRWRGRPAVTLGLWVAAIFVVEAARLVGAPEAIGWLNLILVWGWLHQFGYQLPALRTASRAVLAAVAAVLLAVAILLAVLGPYSAALITVGGDPEMSNLAPPSVVLLCFGAAQILALAALWPVFRTLLANERVWTAVALFGARGMGVYLWHIPLVGVAVGLALWLQLSPEPLSPAWWTLHLAVVVVVIPLAWLVAGVAQIGEGRVDRTPRLAALPAVATALVAGMLVLHVSVTGFATWIGAGMLGLPGSALVNLILLWLAWQSFGAPRAAATATPQPSRA